MSGITVDLSSFEPLMRKFETFPAELQEEIDGELEDAANNFARLAKSSLADQLGISAVKSLKGKKSLNTGLLLGATFAQKSTIPHTWEAGSYKHYAAYNEWGTITKVSVPSDLTAYALQFKGKGIRKTGGMIPKHYFFSQRALVEPKLIANVKNAVDKSWKK